MTSRATGIEPALRGLESRLFPERTLMFGAIIDKRTDVALPVELPDHERPERDSNPQPTA